MIMYIIVIIIIIAHSCTTTQKTLGRNQFHWERGCVLFEVWVFQVLRHVFLLLLISVPLRVCHAPGNPMCVLPGLRLLPGSHTAACSPVSNCS